MTSSDPDQGGWALGGCDFSGGDSASPMRGGHRGIPPGFENVILHGQEEAGADFATDQVHERMRVAEEIRDGERLRP